MKLHELGPAPGAKREPRRVGRGIGSGLGKTSGKGHKGQNARAGGGVRPGFEGGQMPLQRRIPKRGFNNTAFRAKFDVIDLDVLNRFDEGTEVTPEVLYAHRLANPNRDGVKVLGSGELTKKLVVRAHRFSKPAEEKITALGGRAEVI